MFNSNFFAADYFRAVLGAVSEQQPNRGGGSGRVAAYERAIKEKTRLLNDDDDLLILITGFA